jgi:hypothetical protein
MSAPSPKMPQLFPFGIFPSLGRKKGGIHYATFSGRMLAMALDIMLLSFIMAPLQGWVIQTFYPETAGNEAVIKAGMQAQLWLQGQTSWAEFIAALQESGMLQRMILDYSIQFLVVGAIIVWVWQRFHTTPGLAVMGMYVARAADGQPPTINQYMLRYVGTILAIIPLGFGLALSAIDRRKQALQDKLAGTIVIKGDGIFSRWRKQTTLKSEREAFAANYQNLLNPPQEPEETDKT